MGILDEAIREHLELKRAHGAGDSELKQLEDEAFGQAERPGDEEAHDPAAEAPTEFMTQPETAEEPAARREPTITDLQEAPPSLSRGFCAGRRGARGGADGDGARDCRRPARAEG